MLCPWSVTDSGNWRITVDEGDDRVERLKLGGAADRLQWYRSEHDPVPILPSKIINFQISMTRHE